MTTFSEQHFENDGWKMGNKYLTTQESTMYIQVPTVGSHALTLASRFFSTTLLHTLFLMMKLEFWS